MKDYIALWKENITGRRAQTLNTGIHVVGERDKHLGAQHEFARVAIYVEPSDRFEVIDLVEGTNCAREEGFPDNFIFGLLDMLVTMEQGPLIRIRVTLKTAEYDPINSSSRAYWHAGRDAGTKLKAAASGGFAQTQNVH
jgi:hypothetical protein